MYSEYLRARLIWESYPKLNGMQKLKVGTTLWVKTCIKYYNVILYTSFNIGAAPMKIQDFIYQLLKVGRYSFTIAEAEAFLHLRKAATLNAISRLKRKKQIASPAKGFYLIVPPQYQAMECLPAEMFIADLMQYLKLPYYVGFLSAAQFYGSAHQKPQRFQVVTSKNRLPIHCGRIFIEFIAHKNMIDFPTRTFNTTAGFIKVATPEVLAADLVSAPQHAAGISNVATVLSELAENLDSQKLLHLNEIIAENFWIQRLGFLLEYLGYHALADALATAIANKPLHWVRLVARSPYQPMERNAKWKIIVNASVEPDE